MNREYETRKEQKYGRGINVQELRIRKNEKSRILKLKWRKEVHIK